MALVLAVLFGNCFASMTVIWNDTMNTADQWQISDSSFIDFGSGQYCPNSGESNDFCLRMTPDSQTNTAVYMERSTHIADYTALEFQIYVMPYPLWSAECQLSYRYNNDSWTVLSTDQNGFYFMYNTMDFLSIPLPSSTSITIKIEAIAMYRFGSPSCYWDNAILRGIEQTLDPTTEPTSYPTINPTMSTYS